MNRYAQIALDQHRRHRPLEHSRIENPTRFFTEIGDQIQADVTAHRDQVLGPPRPGETIEDYRIRSHQALRAAEELVLADHPLLQPETETGSDRDDPSLTRSLRTLATINTTIHNAP